MGGLEAGAAATLPSVSPRQVTTKQQKADSTPRGRRSNAGDGGSESGEDTADLAGACPASKKEKAFEKELKSLKKRVGSRKGQAALQGQSAQMEDGLWMMSSIMSEGERKFKKE